MYSVFRYSTSPKVLGLNADYKISILTNENERKILKECRFLFSSDKVWMIVNCLGVLGLSFVLCYLRCLVTCLQCMR